ncbi:MAG TPA: phospholipid carrier-dependent glycosyltransferase, partial [Candidatus Limnocylindria bacterium]
MTRDSVRRRGARPIGFPLPRDAVTLLIVIIIGGMLLRVLVGGVLLPLSGFRIDVGDFTAWAQRLAERGPGEFYDPSYFSDYPPGYLYILWLLGSIGRTLQPLLMGVDITPGLVKLPGVLADAGVAVMLFLYSRRYLDGKFGAVWSGERLGLIAAAIYLFNPGTVFNSAVWGQVDAVGALVLLATLYWLARGWTELAAVGATVALLVKFQYAFIIPIVAIVGLKRHLFGRSADPEHDGRRDLLRVLTSLAAGLGTLVALIWPFGLSIWAPSQPTHGLIDRFVSAANLYQGLSINAFNLWRNAWSGLGDTLTWGCDAANPPNCVDGAGVAFTIGSAEVSWQLVGALLFGVAALIAFWQLARRDDPEGLLFGALVLAVAFFALPTRVHERYMFPALALAAPLVLRRWPTSRPWLIAAVVVAVSMGLLLNVLPATGLLHPDTTQPVMQILLLTGLAATPLALAKWGGSALYALLSLSVFANIYWVYTADWSFVEGPPINPGIGGLPMPRDPLLAATLFGDVGIVGLSSMVVVVLLMLVGWAAASAWAPSARRATEPELAAATATAGAGTALLASDPGPGLRRAEAPAPTVMALARNPFDQFVAWLQPDPADPYLRERGRRLDRVDLAVVVGLVVFAFLFRLWRLDMPRSMHFDEVYHARSATEWLTDWQEGWTRDTYEWTHPMLAKYLIAAGIVVANPNQVVSETDTGLPYRALAVATQRQSVGVAESIAFGAAGDDQGTITARTVQDGEVVAEWQAGQPIASLAYDADNQRLLVGLAATGTVHTYDLAAFLSVRGERGPPAEGITIETGLAGVLEIDVPPDQVSLLFRGPDGIVETERATGVELARSEVVAGGVGYVPGVEGDTPTGPFVVATDLERNVLVVLDAATLQPDEDINGEPRAEPLPSTAAGPIEVRGRGDDAQVWVPIGPLPADNEHPAVEGGITVFDERVKEIDTAPLPGRPSLIGWQSVANIMYIAGFDESDQQPAVWTVQPIGNGGSQSAGFAAFDTTLLGGEPLAMGFDISDHDQGEDHGRLLVSVQGDDGGGSLVQIDAGSNAFAWRLAGITFGAVLVALIYLLAATMFSRRRIAVLAGIFVAVDGMSYVMSRIGMNDIYVAVFIAAAYLVFWQVWSGRWPRSAWWALPLVGVLIGLAAATKWVGIYAMLGIWILVFARSALGRFLLVALIGAIAIVMGVGAPWPFTVVALATLALALVIVWVRPVQLEMRDLVGLSATMAVLAAVGLAFALAFNQVEGAREPRNAVELVFSVLARGAQVGWPAYLLLAGAAVLLVIRAVRSVTDPESDRRWQLPGELGGFQWAWVGACLAVIPLLVYFLAYVPYLQLGHPIAGPS